MTDEFSSDTAPVAPPSEHMPAPSPPPDTSEIVNQNRHTALSQLAKSEDISQYAAEREDQDTVIDRGEDIPQERQNQWFRRASKALQDATLEAQGITTNEQGEQEPQEPPPGYVPGDEAMREIENARKTGAAAMRINQYFGNNQEARDNITQWHEAMDPQGVVSQWLIDNESPMAGPIMQRTTEHPEALKQLAEMSPSERSRWLSKLEGHLEAEMQFAQQLAGQQQQWQQDRRTTKAPPIITPPRGGANPPSDIHGLARRGEDVSDYVKLRQQQEKRSRD